ncbi:hypothetical protein [Saccharolobus shibatae]|uniref:Uncharacterized protein n=1 Tax=Saccharolobus shibatae TaxID=2286 RepID=A0A8F5GZP7_9CREN|nr:hypothetical protein [Saccharolobus shibatae]QXJ35534.1 hypothetical protein J5U22_02081 [Saccharolobus shibatae]
MSSILDAILEILATIDVVKEEIKKPLKEEILNLIYQINPEPSVRYDLNELLKEYDARNLLELIQKIKVNVVKK